MTQPNTRLNLASPDNPERALLRAERLLACFQQALGHDLPNRLVTIQGLARLVEADAAAVLDEETRACLAHLAESTEDVLDFVKALADVGRTCRTREAAAEVDLADLWQEVTAVVNWLCRRHTLHYDSVAPLPLVLVPPTSVRRVLVEILRAAARRCPAERPLRLELRSSALKPEAPARDPLAGASGFKQDPLAGASGFNAASAGCKPAATEVIEVQIVDDGPVLSPLQQQQAFEPLTGPDVEPSAGLGLFLARQLVESWGGSLRLEPGPGGGCVATFTALARREDLPP